MHKADEDTNLLQELLTARHSGQPVALATVVNARGSVPRHAGSKMLISPDGRLSGTVGGGEMEARIRDEAMAYNPGDPELFRQLGWMYQHKLGKDLDGPAVADLQERFDDFKRRQFRGFEGLGDVGRVPVAQIFDVDAAGGLEWIDVRNVKLEGGVHGGSLAFWGPQPGTERRSGRGSAPGGR